MAVYTEIWFWLIIVAIILLIVALILWFAITNEDDRWWVWAFLIGGGVLLVIGFIWAAVSWKSPGEAVGVAGIDDTKHVVYHKEEGMPMMHHMDASGAKMTPHEIHETTHVGTVMVPEGHDLEVVHHSEVPVPMMGTAAPITPITTTPLATPPSPLVPLPVIP